MKSPLVSVLICAYNAEKFIEETLLSVLNQSYKNLEVLILDNASTDRSVQKIHNLTHTDNPLLTYEVKKGSSVRLIQNKKNIGPYAGLNLLLEEARGKYIAINDHDDIWHPEKIEKQVSFLEEHKEYVGCGTAMVNWYVRYNKLIYRSQSTYSTLAWHTSLIFKNNGYRYDISVQVGTDFYFIEHILCQNKRLIYNFAEPLVLRRIFEGKQNLSGQWMKSVSVMNILNLKRSWFDKLALLNRYFLPQEWIEHMVMWKYRDNIPSKYMKFVDELKRLTD